MRKRKRRNEKERKIHKIIFNKRHVKFLVQKKKKNTNNIIITI